MSLDSALSKLVLLGLKEASLSVLEEMLHALAEYCGGFGATLWQLRPGTGAPPEELSLEGVQRDPGSGQLYVLAHGFDENRYRCVYHDLALSKATGQSVIRGEYEAKDAASDPLIDHESSFAKQANPGSLYAVRVFFPDTSIGAVTLYRKQSGSIPLNQREQFKFLTAHIPALYASVRDRVAYRLVDRVSVILADAESLAPPDSTPNVSADRQDPALEEVCRSISKALGCLETAIFLADRQGQDGVFSLVATSCSTLLRSAILKRDDQGLTAEVLRSGKSLSVLNLLSMPPKACDETGWHSDPDFVEKVRLLIGYEKDDAMPPFTFAAVPLLGDGKVLGVLRCSICPRAPYFLAEREIELLTILASRIAGHWRRKWRLQGINDAEKSWAKFVDGLSDLSQQTQTLTEKSRSKRSKEALREEIFGKALAVLQKSIPGADTLEVALIDADRKTIGPVAVLGRDWEPYLRTAQNQERTFQRFPLYPPTANSWAFVYSRKKLEFILDTTKADIPYAGVLQRTRQALFAPILVDDECVGILGIRSHLTIREPEKAKSMATLVALIAALYYQLSSILGQQQQVYQDLEHQLRSPIFQAYKRIKFVSQEELRNPTEQLEDRLYDLNAVNGLLSKARRVLGNIRLYEQLAMEQPIAARRVGTPTGEIIKLMIEACSDNRLLWTNKKMAFRVDRLSFERLRLAEIPLDVALFEQVINNLLDNAAKYGDWGSVVTIEGSQDESKRFLEISVKSKGVILLENELVHLGTRGFRSVAAKRRSAEGIGSGLYLVQNILKAHNGYLTPHASDSECFTSITVAFPLSR